MEIVTQTAVETQEFTKGEQRRIAMLELPAMMNLMKWVLRFYPSRQIY